MTQLSKYAAFFAALCLAQPAYAVTSLIGDIDGFGIDPTGLVADHGNDGDGNPNTAPPADVDGDGIIEAGEFLPDWNGNGSVAVGSGDDFDFRSAAELAATDGSEWTDYSVSGANGLADGATFTFVFTVPQFGDIDYGVDHFVNFVFGDYDVTPATLDVDGTTVPLTQQNNANADGLVQSAFATVAWTDMLDGEVIIELNAPNEPYLTFDYALLDTDQFADADEDGVPDPVDNCVFDPNTDQADSDGDGAGDACDVCPDDADDDIDSDGVCGDVDNCPLDANADQADADGDGEGDVCDSCNDLDFDGVCDEDDLCLGTAASDVAAGVPSKRLGANRWADIDGDGVLEQGAPGNGGLPEVITIDDLGGCSCAQIIDELGLGNGHTFFGCSNSAIEDWLYIVGD